MYRSKAHSTMPRVFELPSDKRLDKSGRREAKTAINARKEDRSPVIVIDENLVFRAGLRQIILSGGYELIGEYNTVEELQTFESPTYRCTIMLGIDHDDDDANIFDNSDIMTLGERYSTCNIIVICDRHLTFEQTVTTMAAGGVSAYLLKKDLTPELVLSTLEISALGIMVLSQKFLQIFKDYPCKTPCTAACLPSVRHVGAKPRARKLDHLADFAVLSDREQMILTLLTRGLSNKDIGRELNIADPTVKTHVKNLLRKLRVQNRTQAAMLAAGVSVGWDDTSENMTDDLRVAAL